MSTELIAIISVGVALAGLMLNGQHTQRVEIRAEIQTLRAETQAEFQAVRAETQAEFQVVRAEMREEFKIQREDINRLLGRMAHLEGLLEGLREAIAGRRVTATEDPGQYEQR